MPTLAKNKRVRFDYEILEEYEAGFVLFGAEVKSIKLGRANLEGSYASYEDGELWLKNFQIPAYQVNNQRDYNPLRQRKLLIKKPEMDTLLGKMKQKGLTLLVESLYSTRGLVKAKLVLARGKKKYDKRESIKKRETDRKVARALKRSY